MLEIKEAFDGGRTLKKFDYFPVDDKGEWVEMDTEHFKGKVRKEEKEAGEAAGDDSWWVW